MPPGALMAGAFSVRDAQRAAYEALRPGLRAREIDAIARAKLVEHLQLLAPELPAAAWDGLFERLLPLEPLDWPQITLQVEALFLRAMELHRNGRRGLEAAQWGAKSSVATTPAGSLSSKLSRNVNQIDVKNIEAMKSTAG